MSKHNQLGKKGEDIATDYLIKKGHQLIFRNYRSGHKEVDLITLDEKELVFTEIKTRSSLIFGYPEDSISETKKENLRIAADDFLEKNPQYRSIRFDVISIILNENGIQEIQHFKDAFY